MPDKDTPSKCSGDFVAHRIFDVNHINTSGTVARNMFPVRHSANAKHKRYGAATYQLQLQLHHEAVPFGHPIWRSVWGATACRGLKVARCPIGNPDKSIRNGADRAAKPVADSNAHNAEDRPPSPAAEARRGAVNFSDKGNLQRQTSEELLRLADDLRQERGSLELEIAQLAQPQEIGRDPLGKKHRGALTGNKKDGNRTALKR